MRGEYRGESEGLVVHGRASAQVSNGGLRTPTFWLSESDLQEKQGWGQAFLRTDFPNFFIPLSSSPS